MICHKCGFENKGGDKICSKCEALLDYHEINANNIDISGLALAEENDAGMMVQPSKGSGRKLIVLSVVVLLVVAVAIFIPKYLSQDRARVILEAITVTRNAMETYVKQHRVWPASERDISRSVGSLQSEVMIVISRGVIELSIPEEPGKTATISPAIKQGRIVWSCDNGGIGPEYLPAGCFK